MTMNGIRTLALVALLIPASLRAQNLVVNGGFETGDLTGWTFSTFGGAAGCPPVEYGVTTNAALAGNYGLSGGIPTTGCLGMPNVYFTQTIATIPGAPYLVSGLWQKELASPVGPCAFATDIGSWIQPFQCSSSFAVFFGPATGGGFPYPDGVFNMPVLDFDYGVGAAQPFSRTLVATTASSELRIFMWTQKNYLNVDNLSVTLTPEPSTYALVAAGLLALGIAARRRRKV